jgi:hypothetical protein
MPDLPAFTTPEEFADYEHWFRAKVNASLEDPRPSASHDEVIARLRSLIDSKLAPEAVERRPS